MVKVIIVRIDFDLHKKVNSLVTTVGEILVVNVNVLLVRIKGS